MANNLIENLLVENLTKMFKLPLYRIMLFICGLPVFIVSVLWYIGKRIFMSNDIKSLREIKASIEKVLKESGEYARIESDVLVSLQKKYAFFKKPVSPEKIIAEQKKIVDKRLNELVTVEISKDITVSNANKGFVSFFIGLLKNPIFIIFSLIFGLPMYLLVIIFSIPYIKYIFERLIMLIFVIFGVTFLVFTILYMSPMNPAHNILGITATEESVAEFNRIYGLDKSYAEQLFNTFKGLITFDMGRAYVGNADVIATIMRLFPITLTVALWSMIFLLSIAIPAGIFSAIKPYSSFDYIFMFIALLGLSIPNFWQGLMFILAFSIKLRWLPSMFIEGNWTSLIMPVVVIGTWLAATVARMTRSSMLEVVKQDYVVTAKAKGLPYIKVVFNHILSNAMIPILTVIGLQLGTMLGGSTIVEKVFNIRGLGSFIIDRQFVPDIPIVLAGTIYIAIVISLINLIVDIMYAFIDPRIKSNMKNY